MTKPMSASRLERGFDRRTISGERLGPEELLTIAAERVFDAVRAVDRSPYGADDRALVLAAISRFREYEIALDLVQRTARELGLERKTYGMLAARRALSEKCHNNASNGKTYPPADRGPSGQPDPTANGQGGRDQ